MKSSKRGVLRKRISFSISGVVSLVVLLFYLLGAESATGAVKKQVTPNGGATDKQLLLHKQMG